MSVADAKAHFSECIREAEEGSAVLVTRRGRAVVGIVPAEDVETLRRLRAAGPAGGLASVAGAFDDTPELAEALDLIVAARRRRGPVVLPE